MIENRYKVEKQKVRDDINSETDCIAITPDIWTSIATESYLTMTVHYLTSQWQMKSLISGTMPLSESHIAVNLVVWTKEMVDDCGISKEQIVAFLHDNCKNSDNAGKSLEDEYDWFSIGCTGYLLQLCVNSGLEIQPINRAIGAARRLTTHFRKSEPALRALKSRQKDMRVDSHNLIQDVSTRWNSTFYMVERIVEQRWPITAVLSDNTVTKSSDRYLDLKSEQWEILSALKELLHPLQVATTYFSAEYNVSTSALYPILYGLIRKLIASEDDLPCIKQCKMTISTEIKRRWNLESLSDVSILKILKTAPLVACIIDPCFKQCKV